MRRFIQGGIPGLAATLPLSACIYLRDVPDPPDAGGLSADVGIGTEKATGSDTITHSETGSDTGLAPSADTVSDAGSETAEAMDTGTRSDAAKSSDSTTGSRSDTANATVTVTETLTATDTASETEMATTTETDTVTDPDSCCGSNCENCSEKGKICNEARTTCEQKPCLHDNDCPAPIYVCNIAWGCCAVASCGEQEDFTQCDLWTPVKYAK